MDYSRKTKWHSTALSNEHEFSGSHLYTRVPNAGPLDEITNKLKVISQAANETSAENNALAKEILKYLNSMDIQPQLLSREVIQGLDKISAIMRRENLVDIDGIALAINVEKRKRQELLKSREEKELKKKYEELCWRYSHVQDKLNVVQDKVNSLNDLIASTRQDNDNEYTEMVHKASKLNDYKQHCNALDQELISMEVTDDYPYKILDKYKQYMQTTGELATLNQALSKYGDLPPNILQAKAVLQQKEKQRQEVKKLLKHKMS